MSCGSAPDEPSANALIPASSSDLLMVIGNAVLAAETLPAESVATVEMDQAPSLKVGKSQLVTELVTT